jgi:hypothetical protein
MPKMLATVIVALALAVASQAPASGAAPPRASGVLNPDAVAGAVLHRIGAWLVAVEEYRRREWTAAYRADVAAANAAATAAQAAQARARPAQTTAARTTPGTAHGGGCPSVPSYISYRESRCTYTVENPSGAGGAYQLMPYTADTLAPRIGRPDLVGVNPSRWPAAAQDAAAALLWDHGRGACNWSPPAYCG